VPRRNDQQISPVQGRDLAQVETLGERNDSCIHHLQAQRQARRMDAVELDDWR